MASCMRAPSHYLKQCGLIIKLINKVLWQQFRWIIMKDLKIPISKMRLKLIWWDNFTPSHEIINSFSSDNSFVCVMVLSWYILSPSIIPLGSVCWRGTGYPPHGLLWPHHRGAMSQELKRQTCCMRSQSHERLWPPLLKLKFGNGWLTSKCCGSSCKKFEFQFSIGKTPVRIILWWPITKMLIKACFLVQPLEQEGVYQKCCISLCSKVFINHFYQMKASPECLNILTYCSKYWVDRLRRTMGRKV